MKCPHCQQSIDVSLSKSLSAAEIQGLLDAINHNALRGESEQMVEKLKDRFARYGENTKVTPPQRRWLAQLAKDHPAKKPEGRRYTAPEDEPVVITDSDIPFRSKPILMHNGWHENMQTVPRISSRRSILSPFRHG